MHVGISAIACPVAQGRSRTYEEGIDERASNYSKLIPIESGEGIQSKPGHAASNRSELDVLRGDPTDPTEVRHRLDDIAGEPEVDEHGDETVHEPPHPRNRPTADYVIGFVVECVVEGDDC